MRSLLVIVAIEDGIAFCFALVTAFLLWKINQFQQGTVTLLRAVADAGWGTIHPGNNSNVPATTHARRR